MARMGNPWVRTSNFFGHRSLKNIAVVVDKKSAIGSC